MNIEPVIKWTGSKRSQADSIISYFPKEINVYYEPFLGGGSVAARLMSSPNHNVCQYVLSDANSDLIKLWNSIMYYPESIILGYNELWHELNKDENAVRQKEFYTEKRREFNITRSPELFMFITRTAINGLIRYNGSGEFNSGFHFGRPGIKPTKLAKIVYQWNSLLSQHNVLIHQADYKSMAPFSESLVYCDPPYQATKGIYHGGIKLDEFYNWLRGLKCPYALSFDGRRDGVNVGDELDKDLYKRHVYLSSGKSGFSRVINAEDVAVDESLYLSY